MKKFRFMLSLLLIVVFVSVPVFASASTSITVVMDGQKTKVRQVPVVMNGQSIYSDAPTFIHKSSTLVPLRFVAEHYGSNVDWDPETNSAIVNHGDKKIVMTTNKEEVLVNGVSKVIENNAQPKLVNSGGKYSNLMVPLRFISETLGYEVGYDEERGIPFINSNKDVESPAEGVNNIYLVKGSTDLSKLNIKASTKMDFTHKKEGNKIHLTLKNIGLGNNSLLNNKLSGKPIKSVDVKENGKNVELVVTLTEDYDYNIVTFDNGKELTLSLVNSIGEIKKETVDGRDSVVIYKTKKTLINRMNLNNPNRFVFDIMDSSLGFDYKEFNIKVGSINNVRASQYSPEGSYNTKDRVARVVLDMASGAKESDLEVVETDKKIVITPKMNLSEIVSYNLAGRVANLNIDLEKDTKFSTDYDENAKLITISVPSENIKMNEGSMNIQDGMVENIKLSKSGSNTKIAIKLSRKLKMENLNGGNGNKISLKLEREVNSTTPKDKLIVLDAGHGGGDPGAVSNGVREKDIVLSVTHKLDDILRAKGYNTVMTREDDTFVTLGNRSKIANDADADLFVSIHANSFRGSAANGIETLHNGETKSKGLSQSIQDELIRETGATDRKIKHRPNLAVLRGTKMPSTLVELGFITNPAEVAKLQMESYQNQLAQAIARGIENFFAKFN